MPLQQAAHNSALSYWHKLNNVQDPTSSFFILKLLQGAKRRRIRLTVDYLLQGREELGSTVGY